MRPLLISIALAISAVCFSASCLNVLNEIPQEERVCLEEFFEWLVCQEGLGHVLFFDKPMCLSGFIEDCSPNPLLDIGSGKAREGWKVWKRYAHLFHTPNFLLIEEPLNRKELEDFAKSHNLDLEMRSIFFINKHALVEVIHRHNALFLDLLGTDFSAEGLLRSLENGCSLYAALDQHEGLLGLLLGYGNESSMFYYDHVCTKKKLPPSIVSYPRETQIHPPLFVTKPQSFEAISLRRKYWKQTRELCKIYSRGEFLCTTLQALTKSDYSESDLSLR